MNDVDNGGGYAYMGTGVYGKSLPSSQFCCKPPSTLKHCLKKIKIIL